MWNTLQMMIVINNVNVFDLMLKCIKCQFEWIKLDGAFVPYIKHENGS